MSTPEAPSPEAALEAKKAAFFEKVPEPPANTLVALAEAHDDAEPETDPKGEPAAKPAKAPAKAASSQPAASADAPLADRLVAALKAGDLDTLADLTDQDPAAFDEKSTKWAARNRKEAKLKDEVAKVRADAQAVVEHWEPIDERATRFAATKDYRLVKELVELLTGEDFDSVTMKTFRAVRGEDPRVPELARTLAAKDAELADLRTTKEKASERAMREAIRDDLPADHVVRKVPDWEEKVLKVLRESVDQDTGEPELSFKQAAARVVRHVRDEYSKYAAVFDNEPRPAQTSRRARTPERAESAEPSTSRKRTRDEFFAAFSK
jgi:hypothetical protein